MKQSNYIIIRVAASANSQTTNFRNERVSVNFTVLSFAYNIICASNRLDIIVNNKYKMLKKIGSGAFGDIYKGK